MHIKLLPVIHVFIMFIRIEYLSSSPIYTDILITALINLLLEC